MERRLNIELKIPILVGVITILQFKVEFVLKKDDSHSR
ncbi:conserved protein of unknown function [Kyrpidia spormannii]|uniref:Uncharacterized protein n=1 Tax=Kyrpidia spormannii TaxID=2055160 RepID=A0ACA8ZEJ4_9BACL|nr:conserved protein of unknown function [Kyrpidia spormannii]